MRFVTAYRPVKPSSDKAQFLNFSVDDLKLTKVWFQHSRYFRKRGIRESPEKLFDRHLLAQLKEWRRRGEEIILCGDFIQDIYNSAFARELRGEDLQMEEQYYALTDNEAPYSHVSGSTPI